MSEETKNDSKIDEVKLADMLEALKAKADLLGIKYKGNIGLETLKAKIDAFKPKDDEVDDEEEETSQTKKPMSFDEQIAEAKRKALKLERVIITDLDASQAEDPTIPYNVGNAYFKIGVVIRKDVEQNVPHCIVEALKLKTMVKWKAAINNITKRPTGNKIPVTKKRYSIAYVDKD
jgi:hypothetical protein